MSLVQRIAYVPVRERKGFYDLWSRNESDSLRKQICHLLGYPPEAPAHDGARASSAYRDFCELPTLDMHSFTTAETLNLKLVQAHALFSKDSDMHSPINKEQQGWKAFLESEQTCRLVNAQLTCGSPLPEKGAEAVLMTARRKIEAILGECPRVEDLPLTFGPGASATCRKTTSARWKLQSVPSISSSFLNYGLATFRTAAGRWLSEGPWKGILTVVHGELDFVPKNYKTHRSIVMEPTLSGALQKTVGTVLKRKLLRAGIDLTSQDINRERARVGSLTGAYATLDLSRASDSVAYELVRELLPRDWFELLDMLRTPVVRYKNHLVELEKFSSMGNGYTFELESLIFYSIAYAVAVIEGHSRDISVYGDDIIVTAPLGASLAHWLPVFGFTLNTEKSFMQGPFRESCGFDSFLGVDIRPYYLKGRFSYHTVFCFHNFLQRKPWFDKDGEIRKLLLRTLPSKFLEHWGPDGYGDGHLVSNDSAVVPSYLKPYKRNLGWAGYTFTTLVERPFRDENPCDFGDTLLPYYFAQGSHEEPGPNRRVYPSQWTLEWWRFPVLSEQGWDKAYLNIRRPADAYRKHSSRRVYVLGPR